MDATTHAIKTDQRHDLEFSIDLDGQPQDNLRLTGFTWGETLSSLYHGTATLVSRDPGISLNDCIDRDVTLNTLASWAAAAAFWSGGSVAPAYLYAHAVSGAIVMAAGQDMPAEADVAARYQRYLKHGINIANGGNG